MEKPTDYKPIFTVSVYNTTLQLTREGAGFVALVFGVGLGAINTGNNLLYLILAMCCSFIAVSGTLSEMTLRDIDIRGAIRPAIYANEPAPLLLRIANGKRRWPSYSLRVALMEDSALLAERGLYLFYLPSGGFTEKIIPIRGLQRGPLAISRCRLYTSFPFGFFLKYKIRDLDLRTLVYPPIHDVELPPPSDSSHEGEEIHVAGNEEFRGVREYRPGDPQSRIHWKSTARTGALRVKEFAGGGHQRYTVVLNLADPRSGHDIPADIRERRISQAASLVYHLIRRGDEVSLRMDNQSTGFDNSEAHLDHLLRGLALIAPPP